MGLLALFTHNHLFWVIGLFLAMIDLPDFSTPLRRIGGSVEKMAGVEPEPDAAEAKKRGSFKNFGLHVVDATGFVHALLLRIQALVLPIKTLVLSGH